MLKRRSFLSLLTAFGASPVLPGRALASGTVAQAASYNRYTYGFAVFWARHGGRFGATQLAKALRISEPQAKAMIEDMLRDRLVRVSQRGVEATSLHGGRGGSRPATGQDLGQDFGQIRARNRTRSSPLWRFRRVGLRARRLEWQLRQSSRNLSA
jgi:hypothetical protein